MNPEYVAGSTDGFQAMQRPVITPVVIASDKLYVADMLRRLTVHRTRLSRIASAPLPVTAELDREPVEAREIDSRLANRAA